MAVRLQRPASTVAQPREIHDSELSLIVTRSYNRHWTVEQAVDEYVQNWADQVEKCGADNCPAWGGSEAHIIWLHKSSGAKECWVAAAGQGHTRGHCDPLAILGSIAYCQGSNTLELVNYSATLKSCCFCLGYSGADKGQKTRGKFGDGLPSSTVKLTASGVQISFFTGGQLFTDFGFKMDSSMELECLHMRITSVGEAWNAERLVAHAFSNEAISGRRRHGEGKEVHVCGFPVPDPAQDTVVQLKGISPEYFCAQRYVFLHPDFREASPHRIATVFADVFCDSDERFKGHVFVKDMLATVVKSARGPRFGYNLKKYNVRSRDRQSSIPDDDLSEQLAAVWSKWMEVGMVLTRFSSSEDGPSYELARTALFDAMNCHPECAEVAAVCCNGKTSMAVVCAALVLEFCRRHGGFAVPCPRHDRASQDIIAKKLKKQPVQVSLQLFGCLSASGGSTFSCSAKQVWHQKRLEAARACTALGVDRPPYSRLVPLIRDCFGKILESHFPDVRLVDAPSLEEMAVLDIAPAEFELTGFEGVSRPNLNGLYTEAREKGAVHGEPIFESSSGFRVVFSHIGWVLTSASLFDIRRGSMSTAYGISAYCLQPIWWVQHECPWMVWSEEGWNTCIVKAKDPGRDQWKRISDATLYLNAPSLKSKLHSSSAGASKGVCTSSPNCVCVCQPLFGAVLSDLRDVAKVQVDDSEVEKARELLMSAVVALTRTPFQKEVDELHGAVDKARVTASKSRETERITRWLHRGGVQEEKEQEEEDAEPPSALEERAQELIREQLDLGNLRVNPHRSTTLSWLGDTILDAYLGLVGTEAGLRPRSLDRLRQALFSAKRMGCDAGESGKQVYRASEGREQVVGELTLEWKAQLMEALGDVMDRATLPDAEDPRQEVAFRTEIHRAVDEAQGEEAEEPQRGKRRRVAGRKVCWFFTHKTCRNGFACADAHPCKFFLKGRCKRKSCRFYHGDVDDGTLEEEPPAPPPPPAAEQPPASAKAKKAKAAAARRRLKARKAAARAEKSKAPAEAERPSGSSGASAPARERPYASPLAQRLELSVEEGRPTPRVAPPDRPKQTSAPPPPPRPTRAAPAAPIGAAPTPTRRAPPRGSVAALFALPTPPPPPWRA